MTFLFILSCLLVISSRGYADVASKKVYSKGPKEIIAQSNEKINQLMYELESGKVPGNLNEDVFLHQGDNKIPQEAEKSAKGSFENRDREAKIYRIKELLPGLLPVLPIDPYIPEDFGIVSADAEPNLLKGIYWGVPDEVQAYLQKSGQNINPIFRIQLSNQVSQNGPETFIGDKTVEKELNLKTDTLVKMRKALWGRYPVLILETTDSKGTTAYNAWVGLNSPSGMTLEISLILPANSKQSTERSLKIWNAFLNNTKELPPDFSSNAFHEYTGKGYTMFSVDEARLKVFAQKRISDGKVLIVAIPANANTSFAYEGASEALSKSSTNEGKSIVKVQGRVIYAKEKTSLVIETSIVVYLREVDDFTINYDALKDNKRITVVLNNKVQ
jgi:hypothetical protein